MTSPATPQQSLPYQQLPQQQASVATSPSVPVTAPITMATPPPGSRIYDKYNARMSRILGKTQIIGGVLAFVFNAVGAGITLGGRYDRRRYHGDDTGWGSYWYEANWFYYVAAGLWGATFTILSGSFALSAAKKRTKCAIITHMVLAIWAALVSVGMFGVSVGALVMDAVRLYYGFSYQWHPKQNESERHNRYDYDGPYETHYDYTAERYGQASMVISVLFVLVAMSQVISTIWSSTLGCKLLYTDCTTHSRDQDSIERVQFLADSSGQTQLLVLDRHGRHIRDAKVIQITPSSGSGGLIQGQIITARNQPPEVTNGTPDETAIDNNDADQKKFGYGKLTEC